MVNPNPKALWEIIELQTTDQIKLNEQLYRTNYTVKHFARHYFARHYFARHHAKIFCLSDVYEAHGLSSSRQ